MLIVLKFDNKKNIKTLKNYLSFDFSNQGKKFLNLTMRQPGYLNINCIKVDRLLFLGIVVS